MPSPYMPPLPPPLILQIDIGSGPVKCGSISRAIDLLEPLPALFDSLEREEKGKGSLLDRYLIVQAPGGLSLSIYIHPKESLLDALETSWAELEDPINPPAFDSEGEESLARFSVPALLWQIKPKAGLEGMGAVNG